MPLLRSFYLIASGVLLGTMAFQSVSTEAASFDFNPANTELLAGCASTIGIAVNPEGGNSNAADIEIKYNPSEVTILDSQSSIPGIQIKPGDAYESYFGNQVDPNSGTIRLAGGSFVSQLTSTKTFATIQFESAPGVTSTNFSIVFDGAGATLDSNIVDTSTSTDLLTSVTNGSYIFATAPCQADTQAPRIDFQNPQAFTTGVDTDTFLVRVTDNQSGVDLDSLVFIINGEEYRVSDPEVSYTGDPMDYTFTLKLRSPIPDDEKSTLQVRAPDIKGNRRTSDIVFNIPPEVKEELICPDPELIDTDEDGIPNVQDDDIDGDGVPNQEDDDIDGDGIPNDIDRDDNGNNIADTRESNLFDGGNDSSSNTPSSVTTDTNSDLNQSFGYITQPLTEAAGGIAGVVGIGAAGIMAFAVLGAMTQVLAWITFLFAGRRYALQGTARDMISQDRMAQVDVVLFDAKNQRRHTSITTSATGDFRFDVSTGTYQVMAQQDSQSFAQVYRVPSMAVLGVSHTSLIEAIADGRPAMLRYMWARAQVLWVAITPGLLFGAGVLACINLVFMPSLFNIVAFVAVVILAFLSLRSK